MPPSTPLSIPSVVLDTKSTTPLTGLTTAPRIPLPIPLTKPPAPSYCAPLNGCATIPLTPPHIDFPKPANPLPTPSRTPVGLFLTSETSFAYRYSVSAESTRKPRLIELVILLTEPDTPPATWATKLPVPFIRPRPPDSGPYMKPSWGA